MYIAVCKGIICDCVSAHILSKCTDEGTFERICISSVVSLLKD